MTSQTLCNHFCGAKEHWFPMENEHFCCCTSVKAIVNTTTIVGGKKENTTKDLNLLQVDFGHAWRVIGNN